MNNLVVTVCQVTELNYFFEQAMRKVPIDLVIFSNEFDATDPLN